MPLDSIEGSLKERGVRLTRQRQILLDLIDKTGEHLDAERLFTMAKERDAKINRVTVYRTLKLLKAGGLVDELDLMHYGGDQHYYVADTTRFADATGWAPKTSPRAGLGEVHDRLVRDGMAQATAGARR